MSRPEQNDDRYACIEVSQCSGDLALFGHLDECARFVQLTIRGAEWGPSRDGTPTIKTNQSDIKIQVAMSVQDFLQMCTNVFANKSRITPCTIQKFGITRYKPLEPMTKKDLAKQISDWFIGTRRQQLARDIDAVSEYIETHKLPKAVAESFRHVLDMRLQEVNDIILYAQEIFMDYCKGEENDRD